LSFLLKYRLQYSLKCLFVTNALAYKFEASVKKRQSFISLIPGHNLFPLKDQVVKEIDGRPGKFSKSKFFNISAGNTKAGSITVPLTSCLTGLESAV
jgi:hypothetical protein